MQFKQGASIFTVEDKEVGHIDRVVVDPKTNEVTHIVVRKGLLFTEDKVVPVSLIASGKGERITLRMDSDKLDALPNYEETHYVALNEEELARGESGPIHVAPASYWYPPYPETPVMPYVEPAYATETKINIPKGTIAVKEGAKVITRDNHHVGNVEQVLTDSQTDRITHFIVSKGLLLKEKKMIPVGWIASLGEEQVDLAVVLRTVQDLPTLEHA